jgi:Transposon-encoded protein TnpV
MYDAKVYAEQHRRFLEEKNPSVQRGQRDQNSYLSSVGQQAEEMFLHLMMQRANQPEVKKLPHLEKVRELEAFRHEAHEMVRHDLIYQPLLDSSTAATPASQVSSRRAIPNYPDEFERDDRDTEKMLATLWRRRQERLSANPPPASPRTK